MQIDKLLTEWLAFAKDVQPSCAAGADQLDFLRASTESELQKLNGSQNSGKPLVSESLPLDRITGYLEQLRDYLSSGETFDFANDSCLNDADDLQAFIISLRQISR